MRPVAAGLITTRTALTTAALLAAIALAIAAAVGPWSLVGVVGGYLAVGAMYSVWLKRQPVIELAAVAAGFVLRAVGGAVAAPAPPSTWFLVVVSFAALFVVTGKRASEQRSLADDGVGHRAVLAQYPPSFLAQTMTMCAAVTVTAYCLWAFAGDGLRAHAGHHFVWIQLTVVPLVLGILYVQRLFGLGEGGAPEDLAVHDRTLQLVALSWVVLFAVGIYG